MSAAGVGFIVVVSLGILLIVLGTIMIGMLVWPR